MEDFLLTNAFFEAEISAMRVQLREYIKENYGDIPGYVKAELGLTDENIAKLQTL